VNLLLKSLELKLTHHLSRERHRFSRHLWLTTGLLIVLAGAFATYTWSEKQIDRANESRHQSFLLADELRQSSDDLTRMARTYVLTADPRFKSAYQSILAIRDGKAARPANYQNVYWDTVLTPGHTPEPAAGPTVALLELMRQAGFTPQEMAKLAQAKANSDQLTATETAAIQRVESTGPQAQADRDHARTMLHDDAYHQAKAAIMLPIQEFYSLVDQRTIRAVESAQTTALLLRLVFVAFSLSLVLMLWQTKKLLRDTLGGTVDEIFDHISRIGRDDLQTPIVVNPKDQSSVLGWLSKTQISLRNIEHERQRAQAMQVDSEAHLRAIVEAEPECIKIVDAQGRLTQMNPAGLTMIEADSLEQVAGRAVIQLIAPEHRDDFNRLHQRVLAGESGQMEFEILGLKGGRRWLETHAVPMLDHGQTVQLAVTRDITDRKRAQEAQRIAATAFESQQGMMITDTARVILRVNKAFTQITGYGAEEAVGQTPRLLKSGRHDGAFYAAMNTSLQQNAGWTGEILNKRKNGEVFPQWLTISAVQDDAGQATHYVATFTDLSESKIAQAQIETLAFYDPLTKLPNRRLLMDRLDQAVSASARHSRRSALLLIDLDNFKMLNDSLGHVEGDLLLVQVTERLHACVREDDTLARLGSDEFVVMLNDLSMNAFTAATQAEAIGEKLRASFEQSFALTHGAHHSTASIGITLFGGDLIQANDQPLKRAELAMFQAKAAGRNVLRFFDAKMQADVSSHAALEADLREAVQKQQFLLHYQAQVVGDGRLTGVEALVRWQHPSRGMVSPAQFIALAESSGLILPIGQWVLDTACLQLTAWASQPDLAHLTVAVNVSARQFQQADFVDSVLATLARTQANPKRLKLELTESMLVNDVEGIIAKMSELKAHGVGFSLDDFGTGYSSLSYLKRLPLDQLKIDQGFVRNIVTDPNDAAIAKMVVALAESLGLAVIAEGVELQAQADFLAHQGCHAYQGYLFSRPLPISAFEAFARGALAAPADAKA